MTAHDNLLNMLTERADQRTENSKHRLRRSPFTQKKLPPASAAPTEPLGQLQLPLADLAPLGQVAAQQTCCSRRGDFHAERACCMP